MVIDENLIFVALIIIFVIFLVNKQPKLIALIVFIILFYYIYKSRFTNPREFIEFIKHKFTEGFEPCSMMNPAYCGGDYGSSNMTFLPDSIRSAPINNNINNLVNVSLKAADYQIDKRMKVGVRDITIDEMIASVPPLLDYKMYLEKIVKFVLNVKSDDPIQKEFLAKKLRHKMTMIFYNAYNTVNEKSYPINTYNDLLYAEREFNDTLNIFIFLGMNESDSYTLSLLQKEFKDLNNKLNEFVIEKVNDILPNDYDITTSFLPKKDEPEGISTMDYYISLDKSYHL
jgi:hypothetical protein